jgi:hypothetical protein
MRMRRIGMATLASAVALGGMVIGIGPASAGKPSLAGTLSCNASGTINISPSLVLAIPNKKEATATKPAKPGKDKGPKYNSTGTLLNCTGSEPVSHLTPPTGATTTSKSKGASRLCTGGGAGGSSAGTKNKITFNNGAKGKVTSSQSPLSAFNTGTQVFTPAPPTGSPLAVAAAWVFDHINERLAFTTTGTAAGKVYGGKHVATTVVTTETLGNLFTVQCAGAGISALHLDPVYSTTVIS